MAVRQNVARPVRTGTQLGVAEVIVQVVEAFFVDLNEAQHVALLAALTLATGILQIMIEDGLGKGFLRQVPGPQVEVVEEKPAADDLGARIEAAPSVSGKVPVADKAVARKAKAKRAPRKPTR